MKIWGKHSVLEAVTNPSRSISRLRIARGSEDGLQNIIEAAKRRGIEIKFEERKVLDRITDEGRHQGVIAEAAALGLVSLDELIKDARANPKGALLLVLDEIEDPRNLGAILRTAAVAECDGVIMTVRRSAPLDGSAQKTAAGALERLKIAEVTNLATALEKLKGAVWIVGAEAGAAKAHSEADLAKPMALVMGGEGHGLRELTKKNCDELIRIPANPEFSVLNVSVAAGVLLFEARRQRVISR